MSKYSEDFIYEDEVQKKVEMHMRFKWCKRIIIILSRRISAEA